MRLNFKKPLQFLLFKILTPHCLVKMINNENVKKCLSQVVCGDNSRFYPEARVENISGIKEKIQIGSGTHIRGQLLVLSYSKGLNIGNNSYIGEGSIIRSYDKINIGNDVLIAHNVTIIDSDSHEIDYIDRAASFEKMIKSGHPLAPGNVKTKPIYIDDYAWVSNSVCILKGVTVGKGAIIAAGAIVTKDVAPFTMVAGNPAKFIKDLPH